MMYRCHVLRYFSLCFTESNFGVGGHFVSPCLLLQEIPPGFSVVNNGTYREFFDLSNVLPAFFPCPPPPPTTTHILGVCYCERWNSFPMTHCQPRVGGVQPLVERPYNSLCIKAEGFLPVLVEAIKTIKYIIYWLLLLRAFGFYVQLLWARHVVADVSFVLNTFSEFLMVLFMYSLLRFHTEMFNTCRTTYNFSTLVEHIVYST